MTPSGNPLIARTGSVAVATLAIGQLALGPFPHFWIADEICVSASQSSNSEVIFAPFVSTQIPALGTVNPSGFYLIQPGHTLLDGIGASSIPCIAALIRQWRMFTSSPFHNQPVYLIARFQNAASGTSSYTLSVRGHIAQ